jgi:integrase
MEGAEGGPRVAGRTEIVMRPERLPASKKSVEWELRRDRFLTPQEISEKLLPAARANPDPRVYFLCYVIANVGGRISEIISLRAGDLHKTDPILRVSTLKRGRSHVRDLTLPESVAQAIRQWIVRHEMKSEDYLFPSNPRRPAARHMTRQWANRLFDKALIAAGLKVWAHTGPDGQRRLGIGPHAARHANALDLMQQSQEALGLSPLDALHLIKQRLGHSSLKSTLVYLHATNDAQIATKLRPME